MSPAHVARPFLCVGAIGAWTTMSTFAVETDLLARNGHVGVAVAYVGASLVGGLTAVWMGLSLGRVVPIRRRSR